MQEKFCAASLLELVDSSFALSVTQVGKLRQVQRLTYGVPNEIDTSNADMIIASNYKITQERKILDIIFLRHFNYSFNDSGSRLGALESIQWFIRIEREKMKLDSIYNCVITICLTGDGLRIGTTNVHATYLRPLYSQRALDYLVIGCNTGPDDKENFVKYSLPIYKEMEILCKYPLEVDGEMWEVKLTVSADLKEAWHISGDGHVDKCFLCPKKLVSGAHCMLRPACIHCQLQHPGRKLCRHVPDLDRVRPVMHFHKVKYPSNIQELSVTELRAFALRLGIQIHDSNNRLINKPELLATVRRWKEMNGVVLDTHTGNDLLNIANASEAAIDINLNVRFSEEWQQTDVWQQLQQEISKSSAPIEVKRKALEVCLLLEEHFQYVENLDSKDGIDDVRSIIMDILHCKVRVKNKLLALMVQSIFDRTDLNTVQKDERVKAVNAVLGRIYASKIGTESNIKVSVHVRVHVP